MTPGLGSQADAVAENDARPFDAARTLPFDIGGASRMITVWHLYGTAVVGMALTGFLVWITEYYTCWP